MVYGRYNELVFMGFINPQTSLGGTTLYIPIESNYMNYYIRPILYYSHIIPTKYYYSHIRPIIFPFQLHSH